MLPHPAFQCYLFVGMGKPRFLVGRVRLRSSNTKSGPYQMLQKGWDLSTGILDKTSALEVLGTSWLQAS